MAVQLGANSKDHRALLTLGGVNWGEWEELGSPEISNDGEVRFRIPGTVFETSGGSVKSIDTIEGSRHWKRGRDAALLKQALTATLKGTDLEGPLSFHEVMEDGTLDPSPYLTVDVLLDKYKAPDVNSGSEDAMFEIGLAPNGDPR